MKVDELIAKSLEELDTLIKGEEETPKEDTLTKGEPTPDEVSKNAPEEDDEPEEGEPGAVSGGDNPEEGEDNPEEGEGDPEQGDEPDVDSDEEEETEKSLEEELNGSDSVRKALEVSEFLDGLVKGISKIIDKNTETVNKSLLATESNQELLAKSFQGLAKSQQAVLKIQAELSKSLEKVVGRISKLEATPQVRKSVQTKAEVVEKSFNASLGEKPSTESLNKSEVLAKLTEAITGQGRGEFMPDLMAYEHMGDPSVLSPAARAYLNIK